MALPVTALYAALLGLLYAVLTLLVVRGRFGSKVMLGTGQKASFGLVPSVTDCPVHCEMSRSSRSRTSSLETASGTATAASTETPTIRRARQMIHLTARPRFRTLPAKNHLAANTTASNLRN